MSLHELKKKTSDGTDVVCMNLKKISDGTDVEMLRPVLKFYGLGGRQIGGIESFYVNSRACVNVGYSMSDWLVSR